MRFLLNCSLLISVLRASPPTLSMRPCKNISHTELLVTKFFPTPPVKLRLGLQVGGTLLIENHLDLSTYLTNQKHGAINKYDLTVFFTLFQVFFTALKAVVLFRAQQSSSPADSLMNLIQDFQCRVTYWVLVEMLYLHPHMVNGH